MSDNDDDDLIEHTTFAVEIEVEKMLSETDEDEDDEDAAMLIVSASKKKNSAGSNTASPSAKESALQKKKTLRETMDHLELFSHKMNRKFKKGDKRKQMRKSLSHNVVSINNSQASPWKDPNVSSLGLMSGQKKPMQSMYEK